MDFVAPLSITHPLLHVSDKEDIFSFAYTLAIIGAAGYNFGKDYLDRDSEDLYVRHRTSSNFIPTYKRLVVRQCCFDGFFRGTEPVKTCRLNY